MLLGLLQLLAGSLELLDLLRYCQGISGITDLTPFLRLFRCLVEGFVHELIEVKVWVLIAFKVIIQVLLQVIMVIGVICKGF